MWVDVCEDLPQLAKGYTKVSIDINVKTDKGYVIEDCFYSYGNDKFYDRHGNAVRNKRGNVVAWQTR